MRRPCLTFATNGMPECRVTTVTSATDLIFNTNRGNAARRQAATAVTAVVSGNGGNVPNAAALPIYLNEINGVAPVTPVTPLGIDHHDHGTWMED